tara:strand:+ start:816 stop:995 length:180 start_codon:yes stop_codon:yes gene_type:complete
MKKMKNKGLFNAPIESLKEELAILTTHLFGTRSVQDTLELLNNIDAITAELRRRYDNET